MNLDLSLFGPDWALLVAVAVFAVLALLESLRPLGRAPEAGEARLVANFALGMLATVLSAIVPFGVQDVAGFAAVQRIGLFHAVHAPAVLQIAVAILAESFVAYWVHRASHRSALLWRVHAVHHSDRAVDISTGFRNHPLELALSLPVTLGVVLLLGLAQDVALVLVTAGYVGAFWQHAAIRLPGWLERSLRRVLVTPALHRLHHTEPRAVHDSNYGGLLIVWDRLFGTFRGEAPDALVTGLAGDAPRDLALASLLVRPFRPALRPATP